MQSVHDRFDLTEELLPVDDVQGIFAVASEVMLDHAPDQGNTRIERLARWVLANLDGSLVCGITGPRTCVIPTSRVHVLCAGDRVAVDLSGRREFSADESRELATALLKGADWAETHR